jgi:hypothetical protein
VKTCLKCGQVKPLDEFAKRKGRVDGRSPYCKQCLRGRSSTPITEWKRKPSTAEIEASKRESKICVRCKVEKPLSEFTDAKTSIDGKASYCKPCRREIQKRFKALPERRREKYRERKKEIRRVIREKRVAVKSELIRRHGGRCGHCGLVLSEDWPVDCFDFHHPGGGGKEKRLSSLLGRTKDLERLWKMVKGCLVLCANCHRKETAQERRIRDE